MNPGANSFVWFADWTILQKFIIIKVYTENTQLGNQIKKA